MTVISHLGIDQGRALAYLRSSRLLAQFAFALCLLLVSADGMIALHGASRVSKPELDPCRSSISPHLVGIGGLSLQTKFAVKEIDTGMVGSFPCNMTTRSYISFHYGSVRRLAVGSTITSSQTLIRASLAPVLFHHPNPSLEPPVACRQQWVSQPQSAPTVRVPMEVLAGVRLLLRQAVLEVSGFDPVSCFLRYLTQV
jgi:hypothetical protein